MSKMDIYVVHGEIRLGCGQSLEQANAIIILLGKQYLTSEDGWCFDITQQYKGIGINKYSWRNQYEYNDYLVMGDLKKFYENYEEAKQSYDFCLTMYETMDIKYKPYFHLEHWCEYDNLDQKRIIDLYDDENHCPNLSSSDGSDL